MLVIFNKRVAKSCSYRPEEDNDDYDTDRDDGDHYYDYRRFANAYT